MGAGRQKLHRAAAAGRLGQVVRILERDPAAATALNGAGRSALHCVATRTGAMPCTRAAVMRALLAAAPRMAIAQDADGLTPLALAVDAGNAESVALLARAVPVAALAREAYLDGTPLHRAVRKAEPSAEVITHLLAAAPSAALATDSLGRTPLLALLDSCLPEGPQAEAAASQLYEACPEAALVADHRGMLPLAAAVRRLGRSALVTRLLRDAPQAAAAASATGDTALHVAARQCGSAGLVAELLAVAPEAATLPNQDGCTPLRLAAAADEAAAALLLEAAPQTAATADNFDVTPIAAAVDSGFEALVDRLCALLPMAALMSASSSGDTPLHLAARRNDGLSLVAKLLAAAPPAALRLDSQGRTPLRLAVDAHAAPSALLLLAAAPEAARLPSTEWGGQRGFLPLHAAAYTGQPRLVAALLEAAPETATATDAHGGCALSWAAQFGRCEEVRRLLIEQAPEALFLQDLDEDTPLHCAAVEGNAPAVAQLATAQPAVCALRNASGHTPFGLAVQHRSARNGLQAAEHLIAFGPAADLVSALAAADEEEVAARLVPQLVARWRLTALEWGLLPASVPGLWRVLPAVLERSAEEAAALVLHMMAEEREQMWTAALCLARLQRCQGRELPPDVLATILALGHD